MSIFNPRGWTRFITVFAFVLFAAYAGPAMAQSAPAACNQGGTVTLPVSPAPFIFATITIQPGQSATLTVSGTGTFASGFIPGPGGGSTTTYQNTGATPIITQAAIVVSSAGTFNWYLTGSTCTNTVSAPVLNPWLLCLLCAALVLIGVSGRSIRRLRR